MIFKVSLCCVVLYCFLFHCIVLYFIGRLECDIFGNLIYSYQEICIAPFSTVRRRSRTLAYKASSLIKLIHFHTRNLKSKSILCRVPMYKQEGDRFIQHVVDCLDEVC